MTQDEEGRAPATIALLPCPFCGEPPEHINIGHTTEAICCRNRSCPAKPSVWSWDKTIAAWNTRHRTEAQAKLREALEAARDFLRSAPLESGICCCGDAVDAHNMGSGHSPVDDLAYYAGQIEEQVTAALDASK